MRNFDEALLRRGRVEAAAPFPPLFQALRIALSGEHAARAFHRRVSEAFPGKAPFAAAAQLVERRIALLARLSSRYGVPLPQDPFAQETAIAPAWRINLERAVAGELATARRYQQLLAHALPPELADAFARLHRESLQKQLPRFQDALRKAVDTEMLHARHGVPANEAHMEHGPLSSFMEKAFSVLAGQHYAFGMMAPLLRARPALLGGVLAGSAGMYLARRRLSSDSGPTHVRRNGKEG
ncbi:MAG: ferritin [Candidatus Dactylopiibacterium sp.]|nr:ferritin [Candidatus Dactylopiibacterium sp.]